MPSIDEYQIKLDGLIDAETVNDYLDDHLSRHDAAISQSRQNLLMARTKGRKFLARLSHSFDSTAKQELNYYTIMLLVIHEHLHSLKYLYAKYKNNTINKNDNARNLNLTWLYRWSNWIVESVKTFFCYLFARGTRGTRRAQGVMTATPFEITIITDCDNEIDKILTTAIQHKFDNDKQNEMYRIYFNYVKDAYVHFKELKAHNGPDIEKFAIYLNAMEKMLLSFDFMVNKILKEAKNKHQHPLQKIREGTISISWSFCYNKNNSKSSEAYGNMSVSIPLYYK